MYDFLNKRSLQITDNEWEIEYDLAVSDNGDYAFVSYNRKSSFPQIIMNGAVLEQVSEGVYCKKLSFLGNNLVFVADNLTEGISRFIIINSISKEVTEYNLSIAVYQIVTDKKDSNNHIYLAGVDIERGNYCVIDIDAREKNYETIYTSNNIIFIDEYPENKCMISEISGNSDGLYTLLAYNEIYGSQYLNPFAGTNNYCGRLSWYQSNRLLGLLRLFEITEDESIKTQILQTVEGLLSCTNGNIGIDLPNNPSFLWSTLIYGVDTNEPDTLLVNQACIIDSLLAAVQKNIVDDKTSREIIEIAELAYNYYEQDYYLKDQAYHFRYNSNFYLDGVIMPFNQQNMWGIVLCRLYDITGDERYKKRGKGIGIKF